MQHTITPDELASVLVARWEQEAADQARMGRDRDWYEDLGMGIVNVYGTPELTGASYKYTISLSRTEGC